VALHRRDARLIDRLDEVFRRRASSTPNKKIVTTVLQFKIDFCKYCARD
jgi:hypothetical protein